VAITFGARTGVALWSSEDDHPQRADFQTSHQAVEDKMAIDVQGTLAARPAPTVRGRYYWATDDRGLGPHRDDGVTWTDLGPSPVEGPLAGGFTARIAGHAVAGVADPVLLVRGKAGQTGDLARLTDPTGATTLWRVDSGGKVWANAGAAVTPANTAATGLTVDSAAGQTGDLMSLRVNGAAVATVTPAGRGIVTGGIDVSGSVSGYTGGELRFPSGAGDAGISTLTTGAQSMNFDHRGAGNTGGWAWRNGTGAANTVMDLTAAGGLKVRGQAAGIVTGTFLQAAASGRPALRVESATTATGDGLYQLELRHNSYAGGNVLVGEREDGRFSVAWELGGGVSEKLSLTNAGVLTAFGNIVASGGDLRSQAAGGVSRLYLKATDAATDTKVWDLIPLSGNLTGRIVNDAESSTTTWLAVNRTGMTVTSIVLSATVVKTNGGGGAGLQFSQSGTDTGRVTATGAGAVHLELIAGSQPSGQVRLCANGGTAVVAASGQPGATTLGFFAATPVGKPAIAGSRAGNAALASLLTNLATLGLVTDSTTA
jgi:hypothetical protein